MITHTEVLQTLQDIVTEFGDGYVYPLKYRDAHDACVYATPDGTPRCIVGQVLHRHDLLHLLRTETGFENGGAGEMHGISCHFTPAAIDVLTAAQRRQDGNYDNTWGGALLAAKEEATRAE